MNDYIQFEEEFSKLFRSSWRSGFISSSLESLESIQHVFLFMCRYTSFNSVFAGGVAALTARIHCAQSVFVDVDEKDAIFADRSAEVASRIFFAAEDEYDAKHLGKRITHRSLAQFFLRELKLLASEDEEALAKWNPTPEHIELVRQVQQTYGCDDSDLSLFRGMGFHLASERFADQEFNVIDEFFRSRHPKVVTSLTSTNGPSGISAYYWIKAHCSVESDHADAASDAIKYALSYYNGSEQKETLIEEILNGVRHFVALQESIFKRDEEHQNT